MIITTNKNGITRKVVFNDSVLLVDKEDVLSFELTEPKYEIPLKLNFTFSNEGDELTTSGETKDNGSTLNLTLHKWERPNGAELIDPIDFKVDGVQFWIRFRTAAKSENSFRLFHLTIWKEI
ncbi:MAG: hypothetical protein HRT69_15775 [Flavobacteriaceae bacterium]|nr:hypothetical protein [Flavobacteriaceae bacterium]